MLVINAQDFFYSSKMHISSLSASTHLHQSRNFSGTSTPVENQGSTQEKKTDNENPSKAPIDVTKIESALNEAELKQVRELKVRDREVRAHEQAHISAAGGIAKSAARFQYQRGPDGQLYAVGGEVQIDTSAVAGDPKATAEKARRIQRAALAPAMPSSQDRAIAAQAATMQAKAQAEILVASSSEAEINNAKDKIDMVYETNDVPETSSQCAICGEKHSAESHSATIENHLHNAIAFADVPEESTKRAGNILNIVI